MSQKKPHKLTVRQKEGSRGIMTGANTEILLDGKPLKYVNSLSFSVNASGVAQCFIGIMANVEIDGETLTELSGTTGELQDEWRQYNGNGVLERTIATLNGVPNDTISAINTLVEPINTLVEPIKPLAYPTQNDSRKTNEDDLVSKGWVK